MKIGGKKIDVMPSTDFIVFPRGGEGKDIGFRVTAMLDKEEFDKYCREPKPGKMRVRGQSQLVENYDDPKYKQAIIRYNQMWMDFMFVTSLSGLAEKENEPDPEIEWEKVKRNDKNTWHLWDEELKEIGLSNLERRQLYNLSMGVNSLSESRLDEARKSFLQRQREEREGSYSQTDEPTDMQSGELANEQEFDSQDAQNLGTDSTNE